MARLRVFAVLAVSLTAVTAAAAPAASARESIKKAFFAGSGEAFAGGRNEFPVYRDLGVGVVQTNIDWNEVVTRRPRNPRDPNDAAYRWDARVDRFVAEARRHGMRVALLIGRSPRYANGGRGKTHAPRPGAFADFATAAARRYRSVRLWMIWGEPNRNANTLAPFNSRTPRVYAGLLDAAYGALKRVDRRNLVIGGMTFTFGDISTCTWIRRMRLRNGRPPRMDMYGHNPFPYARSPRLADPVAPRCGIDFGGLDTLARLVDRQLTRGRRSKKLFLSEFAIPTAPRDGEFGYWVDPPVQADWIRKALRIARSWSRIYTLGWVHLRDDRVENYDRRAGLIDTSGNRKPGYFAFRAG